MDQLETNGDNDLLCHWLAILRSGRERPSCNAPQSRGVEIPVSTRTVDFRVASLAVDVHLGHNLRRTLFPGRHGRRGIFDGSADDRRRGFGGRCVRTHGKRSHNKPCRCRAFAKRHAYPPVEPNKAASSLDPALTSVIVVFALVAHGEDGDGGVILDLVQKYIARVAK